jgi:hypothetical protein
MNQKLKLIYFRYFFCGRDDVYAFRIPEGGYRPRRRPQFDLTDQMLMQHMQGQVMLGAYPLLRDGTTRWVAADFDGKNDNAFEEAFLLKQSLESHGIETLCNVSQSGRGVHVRVIFDKYIAAWLARNLMKAFIERENILPIKDGGAFDRLFPTQDELDPRDPRAIGNQIAMPLHKGAAEERGGSMLLDHDFQRLELGEQTWDHLELYERVTSLQIWDAFDEIGRRGLMTTGTELQQRNEENRKQRMRGESSDWRGLRQKTAADLQYIFANCEFMKHGLTGNLSYDEWWILAAILAQFDGHGGRTLWHHISSMDARYDAQQAEKKYDNILSKMGAPVRCETISSYGWTCPMMGANGECSRFKNNYGRGPRTPATICHFVSDVAA